MTGNRPAVRPARPFFSSGPCAKRPGWTPEALNDSCLGRSHRSKPGKAKLKEAIDRTRPVDVLAWESFGEDWVTDVAKQLKLKDTRIIKSAYGELPDLRQTDPSHDIVFLWNGTTSGVRVPDGEWLADDRQGLTICDATSAAYAMDL